MSEALALVVDDEADIRELLELTLQRMQVRAVSAATLEEARKLLASEPVNLCLTDMRLPDGDGLELVEHIQLTRPEVPVAVITAHGSMQSAIQALKLGAFDFVTKPVELRVLRDLITTALKLACPPPATGHALLGDSPPMQRIRALIGKLARSQAPLYISGESGSGKELVARMIHEQGPRADHPFVPVNCGAIPSELMESEFFGHRKGSFTGALGDKEGLFQAAHGGTLFLDEVAELPLPMQVKLLRAIQEKAVRPVGAQREVPVDVRILSATHKNLATLVEAGAFRQDLFYRINVIELQVPPLRERPEDIPLLADHFLTRIAAAFGAPKPRLNEESLKALRTYPFPGNVRELENILERALTLCEGEEVQVADLQLPQAETQQNVHAHPSGPARQPLDNYLENIERETILKTLEETRWNRTAAARRLGITFRSLRYKLKKFGIE